MSKQLLLTFVNEKDYEAMLKVLRELKEDDVFWSYPELMSVNLVKGVQLPEGCT
jgi:hypothetical protein